MLLICPDAAVLVGSAARSGKANRGGRTDSLASSEHLCGKAPLLQVSADIIAVQICVFNTHFPPLDLLCCSDGRDN